MLSLATITVLKEFIYLKSDEIQILLIISRFCPDLIHYVREEQVWNSCRHVIGKSLKLRISDYENALILKTD